MEIITILILSVGLAMDAFAVSVCKGLSINKTSLKDSVIVGLWFGGFQALMPLLGYLAGINFSKYIEAFDHWIAFALLALIGINMIRESFSKEEKSESASLAPKLMFTLAIATSIDALAVGISFAFVNYNIVLSIICIGIITFVISALGVKIGSIFGSKYKNKAELAGGIILILIGLKILFEHLEIIP